MDCFLIKHCLWHEREEIAAAAQIVHEAIERQGYTGTFDFPGIKEELAALRAEITQETQRVQDTRAEVLRLTAGIYCRITAGDTAWYIKQGDVAALGDTPQTCTWYARQKLASGYLGRNRSAQLQKGVSTFSMQINGAEQDLEIRFTPQGSIQVRKGSTAFQVLVDGREGTLDTMPTGDKRRITRKPPPAQERAWDDRIQGLLDYTAGIERRLARYEKQDRKQLRVNLFVPPEWAGLVESHIATAHREIDKIQVELREIQYAYKTLKDAEVPLR
jgi:hypothetical protein